MVTFRIHSSLGLLYAIALTSFTLATPVPQTADETNPTEPLAPPTIWVAGDSTAAWFDPADPSSAGRQGWAVELHSYVTVPVENRALSGRSSRSFIYEGVWLEMMDSIRPGDFVIIEFGHNDDKKDDREAIRGIGHETETRYNTVTGLNETVLTYGGYMRSMVADVILANAHPILSSMTPRYHWVPPKNKTMLTVYPFADWTREIAVEMNVAYVDHLNSSITLLEKVGYKKGVGLFAPNDRTHTNAKGAVELAETFVAAGKCKTGRCGKVHPVMKSFNKLLSRKGEKIKKSCKKGDNSDSEDDDSDDDDYRDD